MGNADHFPGGAAGRLARLHGQVLRAGAQSAQHSHDETELERRREEALIEQRPDAVRVADVEALQLRLHACLVHHPEEIGDVLEGVLEDEIEDELLPARGVLGVVHRSHVERAQRRPHLADVGHAPLHGADPTRGEVQDHRAARLDLAADGGEHGGLVGRPALLGAAVDVHQGGAGLVCPASLLRDLGRRIGHPGTLLARREHARERAGDDHLVGHGYLPFHSGGRFSRNAATPSAASSNRLFRLSCPASASSCCS